MRKLLSLISYAAACLPLLGQPSDRPKFEVAAIKPSAEQRFMNIRNYPGGRLTATAPCACSSNAYGLQSFQIAGGPEWMTPIATKSMPRRRGMRAKRGARDAQSLLEDRFALKTHRETRQLPVYVLIPAKGGNKLAAVEEANCPTSLPEQRLQREAQSDAAVRDHQNRTRSRGSTDPRLEGADA